MTLHRALPMPARLIAACALALLAGPARAQPTYKLDVRDNLAPKATLELKSDRIHRSTLSDDPGFRLQFHFQKAGKTLTTLDARGDTSVALPSLETGEYVVVLELFYPGYKGGNALKGQFKAVTPPLTYRVEAGKPPKVSVVVVKPPTKDPKPVTPAPKKP